MLAVLIVLAILIVVKFVTLIASMRTIGASFAFRGGGFWTAGHGVQGSGFTKVSDKQWCIVLVNSKKSQVNTTSRAGGPDQDSVAGFPDFFVSWLMDVALSDGCGVWAGNRVSRFGYVGLGVLWVQNPTKAYDRTSDAANQLRVETMTYESLRTKPQLSTMLVVFKTQCRLLVLSGSSLV